MKKIDHELYAQLLTLPPLPFLRMVRQDRRALRLARLAFYADGTVPTFSYPLALRFDAQGYLAKLTEVETNIAAIPAPAALLTLYAKKMCRTTTSRELYCGHSTG